MKLSWYPLEAHPVSNFPFWRVIICHIRENVSTDWLIRCRFGRLCTKWISYSRAVKNFIPGLLFDTLFSRLLPLVEVHGHVKLWQNVRHTAPPVSIVRPHCIMLILVRRTTKCQMSAVCLECNSHTNTHTHEKESKKEWTIYEQTSRIYDRNYLFGICNELQKNTLPCSSTIIFIVSFYGKSTIKWINYHCPYLTSNVLKWLYLSFQ